MHTFIYEDERTGAKKTFNLPSDASLSELLEEFQVYVQACGYEIPGEITILNN